MTKIDPSQMEGRGVPLYCLSPKIAKKGRCLNSRDNKVRDRKGSPIRVCGVTKRMSSVGCK
jgi:hypothetical protein